MPGDACLNALALIAVVRNTWSPHTIGDDQPRPGTSAFHTTFVVVDHVVGSVSMAETARPACPRNCGHVVSVGAGPAESIAASPVAARSKDGSITRTTAVYIRHPRCRRASSL